MAAKTYHAISAIDSAMLQGGTVAWPASYHVGLIVATGGVWAANTAYTVGQTIVPSVSGNGHLYVCTQAGTSGASAPTWPTGAGQTVNDGTVVWTEATTEIQSQTITEVTGTGYARVAYSSSSGDWTVDSTGNASNAAPISFPASTGPWGVVFGFALFDASTGGNAWLFGALSAPATIGSGVTPSFAAGALTYSDS